MNTRFILVTVLFLLFGNTYAKDGLRSALHKNDQQFFIENKGQWDADILYMANFGGLNAFITKKGIVYDFYELKEVKDSKKEIRSAIPNSSNEPEPPEMEKYGHMIRINLLGCNEKAVPVGKEKSKTYYNYLIAGDTAHSRGYVGLYKEAVLKSVYEDIDMRYYFEGNSLRYDYILKPGADVRKINMQLEGSEHSYINSDGEWIFTTRFGEVKNTKLLSYQIIDGEQKVIPSKFKKDAKGNIVFELGAYDDTKELVIDPLVYSTLIGSYQAYDYCTSITLDDSNQVYITGYTNVFGWGGPLSAYPTTPGAYAGGAGKDRSIISKFSADGSTLLFSTFFGGDVNWPDRYCRALDISLNTIKQIHAVGYIYSISGRRGFSIKLTADGSSLIYFHQYEDLGNLQTEIKSVKNDKYNATYLAGYTNWAFPPVGYPNLQFPPISDTFFYDVNNNSAQSFVAKQNPNIVYTSAFGMNGSSCNAIEIDSTGNLYAVGNISMAFPNYPYPSSYDSTFNGVSDAYLAKYNSNGVLLNLSYIGGGGLDGATSVQLDKQGNIYVLGYTSSPDFPTTLGCYSDSLKGDSDIFISKFDSTGVNLLFSTYFGGYGGEISTELQIDSLGQMYFSGQTDSSSFPISLGCYDDSYNGFTDVFVTKLNAAGDSVLYSTFLGGNNTDLSAGLALDKFGDVYVAGSTLSAYSFPTTLGSYNQTPYGNYDIFVSKLKLTSCPVVMATASSNTPLCVGGMLNLTSNMTGGFLPYSYHWYGPNGFTSLLQNVNINNIAIADSGIYAVNITDANGCNSSATVLVSINPLPTVTANIDTTLCEGQTLNLGVNAVTGATYNWAGPNGFNAALQNPSIANVIMAANGAYTITIIDANGCSNSDTTSVIINPLPTVVANNDTTFCEGQTLDLTVTPTAGATYYWTGPNGFISALQNPNIANVSMAANGVYTITVTSANGCTNSDTVNVLINPLPSVVANNDTTICEGQTLDLTVTPTAGATYNWTGPNGFISALQNPSIANVTIAANGVYTITAIDVNGCSNSDTTNVLINPLPTVIANNDTTLCEGQTLDLTVTPTAGATYNWSGPNGFTSALQNPSIVNVTMAANGVYTITIYDANGCSNSDTTNVLINPLPTVIANNDTTLCEGQTLDLTITPTAGATYNWTGPNGFISALQNPSIANVTIAANGVYTITAIDVNGCSNSDTTNVLINPLPTVIANNDTTLCEGQTLDLTVTPTAGATYNWSGPNGFTSALQNASIANVTMAANGVYTITAIDVNGCSNSDTTSVIINPLPTVVANNDTTLCEGQTLDLTVTPTAGATYNWSGPNGFTSALQNPSIANVTMAANGDYTVDVVDTNGCSKSDTTNVKILVCTGIAESMQDHTILIFPNPNNGTFTLQTNKLGNYELIDVAGRIIHTYEVKSSPYIIREKLATGMYFIREKEIRNIQGSRAVEKVIIE